MIARVIVNLSLDKAFDYIVPAPLEKDVRTGVQVKVPFGHSSRRGYVVETSEKSSLPSHKLKKIESVCREHPEIPGRLVELGHWIADYYCCTREQAVRALLPAAVRSGKVTRKEIKTYYLESDKGAQEYIFSKGKRAKARAEILKYLLQHPGQTAEAIEQNANVGRSALRALVKNGLVREDRKKIWRDPFRGIEVLPTKNLKPTAEQKNALDIFDSMTENKKGPRTMLLHGVTGSGKTEVYLQAIEKVLDKGGEAIVLVPEISLTPQTIERFRARFGEGISVLHSALSEGERYDEWTRIYEGKVRIVVGARSAVFAPFRNLGLLIVDEEHENSYKQDEAPRYNARDIAVLRAHRENALAILGSATPSMESCTNAFKGKYLLAKLEKRIDDCLMPEMHVVDMRAEAVSKGRPQIFSDPLKEAVIDRIEKGEQTIIFLNRRGFATQMLCMKCGYVAECPECSVSYTYHRSRESLSCHLCGAVLRAPKTCPKCADKNIRYSGLGTEKVEAIAGKLFPSAAVKRMDSDSMTRKNSYEKVLNEFRNGKIDILVGTQMIAKGLHFPNVTLVGIIYADLSLHIPDFRAGERTFQLLTQVAGRAGRGDVPGEVIVQTYTPFNPAIQDAVKYDFKSFFKSEYDIRKTLSYPPCGHMTAIRFRGADEKKVADCADEFLAGLEKDIPRGIIITGPVPAPVARIKGKYRYMIILRGKFNSEFRRKLRRFSMQGKARRDLDIYVDVDPMNLM